MAALTQGASVQSVSEEMGTLTDNMEKIRSISGMVESNAASAQENAAISASLGECAQSLMDTVAQFKLKQS